VKKTILLKVTYRFNAILIKIPKSFVTEIFKKSKNSYGGTMDPEITKAILSKQINAGGITIYDFDIHFTAIVMKTAWYWHKNRREDQ
jgi:hypothetical protein